MRFVKRNFLTLCCLALLVAMGMCGDAWATMGSGSDGSTVMDSAKTKAYTQQGILLSISVLPLAIFNEFSYYYVLLKI